MFPFDFLSPVSKKARMVNIRKVNKTLNLKLARLQLHQETSLLEVNDDQAHEITKLVQTISSTEAGRDELEKIYCEADKIGENGGSILRSIWEEGTLDNRQSFMKDQVVNTTGRKSNRWSPITIRLSLAVYSRSPSAFKALKSLGILHLPSERCLKIHMNHVKKPEGIDDEDIRQSALRYKEHIRSTTAQGKLKPLGQGVLIWDETKVQSNVIWNSRNSSITGFAMSSEDMKSLHDVYEGLFEDELCQKTTYMLQFLWRDLSSDFDVLGPYFTLSSTAEAKCLHSFVTTTMIAFHKYEFHIRCLLCDGASSNLSLLKSLIGIENDITSSSFVSPLDGKNVYLMICPSHQLKNMVAALYSSREEGTKEFVYNDVEHGWYTIEAVYKSDLSRAKCGISRRVPDLKYSHIVRDAWTRLNVLPAKIMQQTYMLSAIKQLVENRPDEQKEHMATYTYLKACNLLFEEGILSEKQISSAASPILKNMREGFKYFEEWRNYISTIQPDDFNFRNQNQKCYLAWQTYDLLQIMYHGFMGLCNDFLSTHPDYFISPIRINGSAVESVFSCLKYITGGHLSSTNYSSSLAALTTQREVAVNPAAEKGYRTDLRVK